MLSVARKSVNIARLGLRRGSKSLSPATISATSAAPLDCSYSLQKQQPQQPCPSDVTISGRQFTSKVDSDGDKNKDMKFVYVHPLSQIVLECLQSNYSEWMIRHGLNDRLSFHRDGTFSLCFHDDNDKEDSRIFTTFDEADKKHWLVVKRGKLVGRYMLQDNLMPAWQAGNNRQSLPARIQKAVTEMVEAIEELDRKGTF